MPVTSLQVLLIEDDPAFSRLVCEILLKDEGSLVPSEYNITQAESLSEALRQIAAVPFDVILIDLALPDSLGIETFTRVQKQAPHTAMIVLTGNQDEDLALQAMQEGAQDYLVKSHVDGYLLNRAIRYAIERKRTHEALRASGDRFRSFVEESSDGVAFSDETGRLIEWNRAMEQITGYTRGEMMGKFFWDMHTIIIPPERRTEWLTAHIRAILEEILSHGTIFSASDMMEVELLTAQGERKLIQEASFPIKTDNGYRIGTLVRDITAKKQAEQALEESQRRLLEAQRLAHLGNWEWELATNRLIWSKEIFHIFGLTPAEFAPSMESLFQAIYPDDRQNVLQQRAELLARGGSLSLDYRVVLPDGRIRHVQERAQTIQDDQGVVRRVNGTLQDISEQKQLEARLRLQSTALESVANTIVITDDQGVIQWANPAFTTLTGYTLAEAAGKNPRELLNSGQQSKEFYKELWDTIMAGKVWHNTLVNRRKDGSLYDEEMTITPLRDEYGQAKQFIAIKQDISERKRAEAAAQRYAIDLEQRVAKRTADLLHLNAELSRANRAKDEFLANMSHELRTPLNGILGLSESLLEQLRGPLNEYQTRMLHTIQSSGYHLLELINDILDLTKIEADKFSIHPEAIFIGDVCQSSLAFVKESATKKAIALHYRSAPTALTLEADPRRLKQILVNLLNNAVKFTPEHGQVSLVVEADLPRKQMHFTITDTGIGIAGEDIERLFKPFEQVDSSLTRQYDGTGLGLALVKKLVELHGGTIQVESEPGKGSQFIVSLPWQPSSDAPLSTPNFTSDEGETRATQTAAFSAPAASRTILLAEENEINLLTFGDYLQSLGTRVIVAHNGLEAIALAEQNNPDVILMDMHMPIMDGLEAIRRLRARPRFAALPIIALTALVMPGDRERCLQAGANEYLSKPVSLRLLGKTINRVLHTD